MEYTAMGCELGLWIGGTLLMQKASDHKIQGL